IGLIGLSTDQLLSVAARWLFPWEPANPSRAGRSASMKRKTQPMVLSVGTPVLDESSGPV
ncbi:MAG TPA: hypothetical protein VIV60_21285, partial [Polyangiaceae bacterium]